ncbi:MAG TPA: hypothetical protein VND64_19865 [Pirellulales bacterium]|nr:hypothetical protein [Pirellulales bacterium]
MRNLKRSLNAMAFFAVGTVFYLACQGSEAVNASAKYQGICAEQHGLMRGWFGPVRTNYADAQGDAAAHTR